MIIDFALGTAVSLSVSEWETRQLHTPAIGQKEPGPGDQKPPLAGGYLVVVGPEKPRPSWNEQNPLRSRIVYVSTDLPNNVTGEI
jgi:hypothetical protein